MYGPELTNCQLIELWETYLMQLDAEEDGAPFGHPAPPAGVVAAPAAKDAASSERPQSPEALPSQSRPDDQMAEEAHAAAQATREMGE